MNSKINLGFKKNIKQEWMDYTLALVISGLSEKEIRSDLRLYLNTQLTEKGKPYSSDSISMIITILSVWFRGNFEYSELRNDMIECASRIPRNEWISLHWAMFNIAYPLWFIVNTQIGKLLSLQPSVTAGQIYDRVKICIGDTETVKRTSRYVIRTVAEWNIFTSDVNNGIYRFNSKIKLENPEVISLLLESILIASSENIEVLELQRHPVIYPFRITYMPGCDICSFCHGRISNMIYGLDREILSVDFKYKIKYRDN